MRDRAKAVARLESMADKPAKHVLFRRIFFLLLISFRGPIA